MGRPKSTDPYSVQRIVWMRQSEWDSVQARMKEEGYNCFAAFARDRMLSRRPARKADAGTASPQTGRLVAEIRRIGSNYNQVARQINAIAATVGKGVSLTSLEARVDRLCALTSELEATVREAVPGFSFSSPPPQDS